MEASIDRAGLPRGSSNEQRLYRPILIKEYSMANHPSAIKRMRQNEQRRRRNASYRSKVKTAVKRYLTAVENKDEQAKEFLRQASSLLHKGTSKGVFHKNTASRAVSRLAKKLPRA